VSETAPISENNPLLRRSVPADWTDLDTRAVDTVRVLAADAVENAGNGHPGTAMSLAPLAYTLFQRVMKHDPNDPEWPARDRFVLSAGHSSVTLYIQLFLAGYGLELVDLERLRTWGSKTPGHPEYRHTRGVETTTGPLGQGLANAVGMAMAARRERGLLDPDPAPGESLFDHHIYVIASDGDIEEGVTSEASSLAGRQELGNLIVFYDDNKISIEDDTAIALSEDTAKRYEAYGWHVQVVEGGEDVVAIEEAIKAAKADPRPSFVLLRTIIGYPAPNKMNTARRGPRRGRGRRGQADPGLRPGQALPGVRRRACRHPQGPQPRQDVAGRMAATLRRLGRGRPRAQGPRGSAGHPEPAGGLGGEAAQLGARRQRDRHAQGLR
jgi:transketolase